MDVHNCFNKIIHAINPVTASRLPSALCQICKFAVREAAVGMKFFSFHQSFDPYLFPFFSL